MSAAVLRRAAELMRLDIEAPGEWEGAEAANAVAQAMADLLDSSAAEVDRLLAKGWPKSKVEFAARHPLAVARAYLGEETQP